MVLCLAALIRDPAVTGLPPWRESRVVYTPVLAPHLLATPRLSFTNSSTVGLSSSPRSKVETPEPG